LKNKKKDESRTTPAGLWTSHSIEPTLKAFLRAKGYTVPELIKIGHDLGELLRHAELRGGIVTLEERHLDAIEIANAIYKEKEWEYRKRWPKDFPIIDDLYSFARVLLDGTSRECTGRRV
jgi:hypothetical protein